MVKSKTMATNERAVFTTGVVLLAALPSLLGCGSGAVAAATFAGADAGAIADPADGFVDRVVDPPEAPKAPARSAATCSGAWVADSPGAVALACRPAQRSTCEGVFAGDEADCPTLAACGADGWPASLPAGALYVRPGVNGGDGSRASPFGTVEAAIAAAPAGATIALAVGAHRLALRPAKDVVLRGACASGTTLAGASGAWSALVVPSGRAVELHDLSVTAEGRAMVVEQGGALRLAGVALRSAREVGVDCYGGALVIERSLVTGVAPAAGQNQGGTGIFVQNGGTATVRRTLVKGNHEVGIGVAGATLTLEDAVLADTSTGSNAVRQGVAFLANDGAIVSMRRVVVERPAGWGLYVQGAQARVTAEDLVVADPRGTPAGEFGLGIEVADGAIVDGSRVHVRGARELGVVATRGARTRLVDATIRSVGVRASDEQLGHGLFAYAGGRIEASHAVVRDASRVAVQVASATSSMALQDAEILETKATPSSKVQGRGLSFADGATGTLARVRVQDARDLGVIVEGGATLTAEDLSVLDVAEELDRGLGGRGISVQQASRFTADRVLVERATEVAAVFTSSSRVEVRDLALRATRRLPKARTWGMGLFVADGADARVDRIAIDGAFGAGVLAALGGAKATLVHASVSNVVPFEKTGEFGAGLVAAVDATLAVRRGRVTNVAMAGAAAMTTAALDLAEVSIRGVAEAKVRLVDAQGEFVDPPVSGLSDGVVAASGARATLSDVAIVGHARAGLITASRSNVVATRVEVRPSGRFGTVRQQGGDVVLDAASVARGSERDDVADGDLPVATRPPATP
jgi:hypothetical protein